MHIKANSGETSELLTLSAAPDVSAKRLQSRLLKRLQQDRRLFGILSWRIYEERPQAERDPSGSPSNCLHSTVE